MKRKANVTVLAIQAAGSLDKTHSLHFRGPKTMLTRHFLATWLDTGKGQLYKVRQSIAWLNYISKQ
jgi:hypothetical protein